MNKSELKSEYKDLVRAGKEKEAQKVLNKLRNLKDAVKENPSVVEESVKEEKPKKKGRKKSKKKVFLNKEVSLDDLEQIKGIGKETLADLKRIYASIEELESALSENKAPFRNDIVRKLNKFLEAKR